MYSVNGIDCFPDCCPHVTARFVSTSLACERTNNVDIRCMLYMARLNTEYFRKIRRVIFGSQPLYPSLSIHTLHVLIQSSSLAAGIVSIIRPTHIDHEESPRPDPVRAYLFHLHCVTGRTVNNTKVRERFFLLPASFSPRP